MKCFCAAFILMVSFRPPVSVAAQERTTVTASDKAYATQLSGTVVDSSGAVIAGATVQIRSANGAVRRTTQSAANGYFDISGLSAGTYRLVVSNPGFETKEISIAIGNTEAAAPLRISLAIDSVNTTVSVEGRADSLIGIAESATQGTVGAVEIQDRPILRSGEVLERFPASSSHNTLAVVRRTNIFFGASISTTARISPSS